MLQIAQVNATLRTDVGRVRPHNEDSVGALEPANDVEIGRHGWLYIVADGVGGAEAGEVASSYATERTKIHYLENEDEPEWGERLRSAVDTANGDLRRLTVERGSGHSYMATTMVAALLRESDAIFVNVGDSRGYLWRHGEISQITKDQSLVAKLLEEGAITEEEAINHPRKNVILSSLGSSKEPKLDLFYVELEPHDKLLLCSDGLTRYVPDSELAEMMGQDEPNIVASQMVDLANERGGADNITVAILEPVFKEPKAKVVPNTTPGEKSTSRSKLAMYTIFLSIIEALLIFWVWYMLRL